MLNIKKINKFIVEEMGLAEENGEYITIILYLSNDDSIEIWFDEENDCYTWSNASYGYEDTFSVMSDIMEYLNSRNITVEDMATL